MKVDKSLAPIVIFVYARPVHTRQMLHSLMLNPEASISQITIYQDGLNPNASKENRKNYLLVTELCKQFISHNKNVNFITLSRNEHIDRLTPRIVTEVLENNDRIIVIEDDLVISKGFLKFMNESLDLYKGSPNVMQINGYMFPIKTRGAYSFFLSLISPWGWGTWKRAWQNYNDDGLALLKEVDKIGKKDFNYGENGYNNYYQMLKQIAYGKENFWDVKWYASIYIKDGLGLFPSKSLVRNIGHDGSGLHCNYFFGSKQFLEQNIIEKIEVNPISTTANLNIAKKFSRYNHKLNNPGFFIKAQQKMQLLWDGLSN